LCWRLSDKCKGIVCHFELVGSIKELGDKSLWRQDPNIGVSRNLEQIAVAADNYTGIACQCAGQELIVVWIFTYGFRQICTMNQLRILNDQIKNSFVFNTAVAACEPFSDIEVFLENFD
jgi:hypothetical protein